MPSVNPADLTEQEKDAMLRLGSPSNQEFLPIEVLDSLVRRGLVKKFTPDRIDFTDLGEAVFEHLKEKQTRRL